MSTNTQNEGLYQRCKSLLSSLWIFISSLIVFFSSGSSTRCKKSFATDSELPMAVVFTAARHSQIMSSMFSPTISSVYINGSKTCSPLFAVPSQPKYVLSTLAFLAHHESGGIASILTVNEIRLNVSSKILQKIRLSESVFLYPDLRHTSRRAAHSITLPSVPLSLWTRTLSTPVPRLP